MSQSKEKEIAAQRQAVKAQTPITEQVGYRSGLRVRVRGQDQDQGQGQGQESASGCWRAEPGADVHVARTALR